MEIKRTSESMINTQQQDSLSKQVKSEPTISRGISSAVDSFQDGTSNTMNAGESTSNQDQLRYRLQTLTTTINENNLSQSGGFAQNQGTASKATRLPGYQSSDSANNSEQVSNQRRESENNLRQRPDLSIGNSEFDGAEAAKQLQEKINNPILIPGTPIKTYTSKESDTPVFNHEKSKLEEYFDGLTKEPGKLQPRFRIGDEE